MRLTAGVTTGLVAAMLVMQGCSSSASASARPTGMTASGSNNGTEGWPITLTVSASALAVGV